MKKLILLLALISSISFAIDKKTPTGGTVKDKSGKSQEQITSSFVGNIVNGTGGYKTSISSTIPFEGFVKTLLSAKLNKGKYIVSYYVSGNYPISCNFDTRGYLNGTNILPFVSIQAIAGQYYMFGRSGIPITITTDNTDLTIQGGASVSGTSSSVFNELFIIKLSDL